MSGRDFAVWADPSAPPPRSRRRPFADAGRDLRLLATAVGKVPRGVPPRQSGPATPPNAALERFSRWVVSPTLDVLVTGRARVGVAGPALVLAHLEDPSDLRPLLGALLPAWRVVPMRARLIPAEAVGLTGLAAGRGGLITADLESPAALAHCQAAAVTAKSHGVPVVPVTVQRTSRPSADRVSARARGPRPLVRGDVHIRFGRALWPQTVEASGLADALGSAIARLLAEDAHTWWLVERDQAPAPLSAEAADWRRNWQRTQPRLPASEGRRPQIWR